VTFFYLSLYLFCCIAVLAPLYAGSLTLSKSSTATVSKGEAVKSTPAATTARSDPNKRPIWIAPTREYKYDASRSGSVALRNVRVEQKEVKKTKKQSDGRKQQRSPALPTLSYAEEPRSSFPSLNRE